VPQRLEQLQQAVQRRLERIAAPVKELQRTYSLEVLQTPQELLRQALQLGLIEGLELRTFVGPKL